MQLTDFFNQLKKRYLIVYTSQKTGFDKIKFVRCAVPYWNIYRFFLLCAAFHLFLWIPSKHKLLKLRFWNNTVSNTFLWRPLIRRLRAQLSTQSCCCVLEIDALQSFPLLDRLRQAANSSKTRITIQSEFWNWLLQSGSKYNASAVYPWVMDEYRTN